MKYGARPDHALDADVRALLSQPTEASAETLDRISGRSRATVARAVREVRLEERTPVSDQGDVGSCYANAWCDAMELLQPARGVVQLSRLFAYFNSRLLHGGEREDEGTYGATMASACQRIGVCQEGSWPYDGAAPPHNQRLFVRPELSNYEEAYDHRTDSSYWIKGASIASRVRAVKDHLDQGFPVVAAFAIGKNWESPNSADVLLPIPNIEGGHAVVLDGYVERSDGQTWFDVRNSWGTSWARRGHVYVDASFLDVAYCDRLDVIVLSPHFAGR